MEGYAPHGLLSLTCGPGSNKRKVAIVAVIVSITVLFCVLVAGLLLTQRKRAGKKTTIWKPNPSRRSSSLSRHKIPNDYGEVLNPGKAELLERGRAHSRNNSKTEEALKLCRIEESSSEFTVYNFAELTAATGDISDENLLGKGGFGPVYKAS
ncbi:putative cysteine-rich receptor-like protein kinase 20 [Panicum miliaceum]|uniref:Cysteine-rich receptor-like protein kinase 20 n=1 Tax=Panicum miliaceum TaxID=4540 RepID=A0A3L6TBX3_PANMI|nr:putative cysteine-rich receptor-like protein kinase 20 [Panicum miliaceum]